MRCHGEACRDGGKQEARPRLRARGKCTFFFGPVLAAPCQGVTDRLAWACTWADDDGQVTVEVQHDQHGRIARSGAQSLFACLGECCPSAIRNDDPFIGRNGMTEVEYNKVLEKNGFAKVRDRTMERSQRQGAALPLTAALSAERGNGQGHKLPKGVAPLGGCVGALYYIQIPPVKGTNTCGWQYDAFLATGHG